MSYNVSQTLGRFFFNSASFDFTTHGVTLDMSDAGDSTDLVTIWAKHFITIADEVALTDVLLSNGHAGTKPCPICRNLIDHRRPYAARDATRTLVPGTCLDTTRFRPHTDASARQNVLRLKPSYDEMIAGTLSVNGYKKVTQLAGWKYHPNSIVVNTSLAYRAISTLHFDWMHIWCVDGIVVREVRGLVAALKAVEPPLLTSLETLAAYLSRWRWPRQRACAAETVFETGSFSATASQTLSCLPVIGKFVRDVIAPVSGDSCGAEIRSFSACCDAVGTLHAASIGLATPDEVETATVAFLRLHLEAYNEEVWTFKHHMSIHVATMFRRAGRLLSCWVHERKHRLVKRFVKDHLNTAGYERSLMLQLTAQHISDFGTWTHNTGLQHVQTATGEVLDALRATSPAIRNAEVSMCLASPTGAKYLRGDMVLLNEAWGGSAAEVWFHVQTDDRPYPCTLAVLHPLAKRDADGRSGVYRKTTDEPQLVPSSAIVCAAITRQSANTITCIWTAEYHRRV